MGGEDFLLFIVNIFHRFSIKADQNVKSLH